jgi:hypothetical protein
MPLINPVLVKLVVDGEPTAVYGPPAVVARFTLYLVAPLLEFQVRITCAFPGTASKPEGASGIVTGTLGEALISGEFALSPAELYAETT